MSEVCTTCGLESCQSPDGITEEPTILDEASTVTSGDRNRYYGPPAHNHGCTAALWEAYLRRKMRARGVEEAAVQSFALDARDVCWLNILQKASRDANRPHRDNLVDTAGYAANAEQLEQ